jgi:Domain of unknown function (DUF4157)
MRDYTMMPSVAESSASAAGKHRDPMVRRDSPQTTGARVGARAHAGGLNRSRWDAARSVLALQRSYGNRYAREVAAIAGPGNGARKVQTRLSPHPESAAALRAMEPVYRQGKTPVLDANGNVSAVDVRPADAAATSRHLESIRGEYGKRGVQRSVAGLAATRGAAFVSEVLGLASPTIRDAAANVDEQGDFDLGARASAALSSSQAGQPLPDAVRERIASMTGGPMRDVRVHDGQGTNRMASQLGARAFTLGRNIYFGAGEYSPATKEGMALLAHEAAHAVQQKGASMPAPGQLTVGSAGDAHEREAERFADAVAENHPSAAPLSINSSLQVARVQRAISFTSDNHVVHKTNTMGVAETATGFQVRPNAFPLFEWTADITIHGNAGDAFGDWEVGPHQVMRYDYTNVHWGTDANHGHRLVQGTPQPLRDALVAGNTWYDDARAATGFTASGDLFNTGLEDSPRTREHPWDNPVAGKTGNFGYFNYGAGFVAYISARHIPDGTGARAFRAINCRYWNVSIQGTFDASRAVGARVVSSGGTVNASDAIDGASVEFPSMHWGPILNDNFVLTET